jgi:dienelactone hydrolase
MRWVVTICLGLIATSTVGAHGTWQFDAVARARATLEQLTKGDFASVVATFNDTVRAALPEDKLRATWASVESQFGAFQQSGEPRSSNMGVMQVVVFPAVFARAKLDIQFAFDGDGRLAGLNIRPAAAATPFTDASYVVPTSFNERDVTVDAGGWPLPGTLSVPTGAGPFPGLVLVHGSGPNDRDETLGPNKPFRDLARGLASRGVAVLRYEKRTRQYGAKIAPLPAFTVKEETVDDAVAAVRALRREPGIAAKRVFVLGHSLGGMLIPRIAAAAPGEIAGLVVMAGAVRSLEQSLIDQTRYLSRADGTISPDEQKQIEQLEQFAAALKKLNPGDTAPSVPGISAPAAYWIDLRGFDPPAAASALEVPMLLLQGGRDYQVTAADFDKWRTTLAKRQDVAFKLYPALNHLFIAGAGPSLPAEYLISGHVDEQVVRDIAEWIAGR